MLRTITLAVAASLIASVLTLETSRKSHVSLLPKVHAMEGCSLQTLHGAYGFYRTGTTPNGPLGAVGIVTYDGKGDSSFKQTIRLDGDTTSEISDGSVDAFYSVSSDCSAKFLNPDGSSFGEAVIVNGGQDIYFISLSDHNTITGVMQKITSQEQD